MDRQKKLVKLLSQKRILIAGYGREGKSTHNFLKQHLPDASPDIGHDDEEIFQLLHQASQTGQPYDLIIKSPGIPTMKLEGRCDPNTITSQTDLFLQIFFNQTIGITGTKGKSTTTALIYHILEISLRKQRRVLMAGNMGKPLFDIISKINNDTIVVCELSCHQLENIHRAPHIGVILNLYQEHLDHYHDYHDYQMAKIQMALRQRTSDHCYYCTDSPDLNALMEAESGHILSKLHPYAYSPELEKYNTKLIGRHNLTNILVVQKVAAKMGVEDYLFHYTLSTFNGLPHRLEWVGKYSNITFYNDSISTIPEATIAALEALQNVDTLILGGFDRNINYNPLCDYLCDTSRHGCKISHFVFVGQAGRRMKEEWESRPDNPLAGADILVEDSYNEIVFWCFEHTRPSHTCLLSPAAASYDSFANFEERGDTFKRYVHMIGHIEG